MEANESTRLFSGIQLFAVIFFVMLLTRCLAGAATLTAPFITPLTFEGRTGCGSWHQGAKTTLTLRSNGKYVYRAILNGREQSEGSGSWREDVSGKKLALGYGSTTPALYQIVDATSLKRLPNTKSAPASSCFERLTQSAHIVEFSGQMRNVTLTSDLWTLETLGAETVAPADSTAPTIAFDAATNRLVGATGCNRLAGTFAQQSAASTSHGAISKLTILSVTTTRRSCLPPLETIEARLVRALKKTTATHICCSTLELFDKHGSKLATFRTTR